MSNLENIPVDGGLVTAKDPSLLAKGELSRANDSFYKPSNPALFKVATKAVANTSSEGSMYGARYLEFDGAPDRVIIGVETSYRISPAQETDMVFTDLATGLIGGKTLDAVHYNNEHFILNGVDRNRVTSVVGVTDSTGHTNYTFSSSVQGMLAATTAPTLSRDAGALTGFTLTTGNLIKYWVEERVKSGSVILRRSASTSSQTVTLTGDGTLDKPVITRPTIVNSDATHWALFATSTNGTFPTGAEIAEVAIATTTIEDTRTGTDPTLPVGSIYEIASVSIVGTSTNVARNGPPPISSTGDIFQGSLVLNDMSDRSKVFYSWPNEPQKFPSIYFIDINKGREVADEITCIRVVGDSLILLARNSVWRVNFLPIQGDSEFNTDRVKAPIEGAHGCVGPLAACTFSTGEGFRMAYISRYGLHITDGYTWDVASDDIGWESTVNVSQLSKAFLVDNPRHYRLEMYYPPLGSNDITKALYFHYHPSHAKGERLKASGPVSITASCAFWGHISGQDLRIVGSLDGFLYTDDADSPAMSVRTGDIVFNGFGNETKLQRLFAHHPASPNATQQANLLAISRREGLDDITRSEPISLARREATSMAWFANSESFQFGFDNSDSLGEVGLNYFVAETSFMGKT